MTIVKCPHCHEVKGCKSPIGWWEEKCENCIEDKTNNCLIKKMDNLDTVYLLCANCLSKSSATEAEEFWSKR